MRKQWKMLSAGIVCGLMLAFAGCGGPQWTCAKVNKQLAVSESKAVQPAPRGDDWWKKRQESVNAQVQKGNVDLLLLGDSITHGWDSQKPLWDKYFGKWNTVNAGFSGDRTQHVLWRLENGNIEGIRPKVAMIMIGTNNSNGNDNTAEEIAEGIAAIVCKLRTELPQTKILLLAIFPRGTKEQRDAKTNGAFNPQWAKNDKASQLASRLADGKNVIFLDINKAFLNDKGELPLEVMPDLLHPKEKGYEIWGEAITPTLEKLMAGK
jgi:beta-glucosidase